jgi:hypothetical protein
VTVLAVRGAEEIGDQALRLTPRVLRPELEAFLRAWAAQFSTAETWGQSLLREGYIEHAEGIWLNLIGSGQGMDRATDEDDDAYRARLTTLQDALTMPSFQSVVETILADLFAAAAEAHDNPGIYVTETWRAEPFLDDNATLQVGDLFLDHAHTLAKPRTVIVIVPEDLDPSLLASLAAALNHIRGAGIRIRLYIEEFTTILPIRRFPWEEL